MRAGGLFVPSQEGTRGSRGRGREAKERRDSIFLVGKGSKRNWKDYFSFPS